MIEFIAFLKTEPLLVGTFSILVALLLIKIFADIFKKYQDLEVNDAVSLMNGDDVIILDVRENKERTDGYIANDVHIPLAQVKTKLSTLDKNKKILAYCRSGNRSAHVARMLSRHEFQNVYNLKGGIRAWQKANMPIAKP